MKPKDILIARVRALRARIQTKRQRCGKILKELEYQKDLPPELEEDMNDLLALENGVAQVACEALGVEKLDEAINRPFLKTTHQKYVDGRDSIAFWQSLRITLRDQEEFLDQTLSNLGWEQTVELLGLADVAKILGVNEADVLDALEKDELKGKKIGSTWRVTKAALDEFLKSQLGYLLATYGRFAETAASGGSR